MNNSEKPAISKICLACPRSCEIRPQVAGVGGQKLCPKGSEFLEQELTSPRRHYFSTVREADNCLYAYRTIEEIPLSEIADHCNRLAAATTPHERNQIHQHFCQTHKTSKLLWGRTSGSLVIAPGSGENRADFWP